MDPSQLWKRYQEYLCTVPSVGFALDISRMGFDDRFLREMEPRLQQAFVAMAELEKGSIANPDENRMVGHYWLRAPGMAPSPDLRQAIVQTVERIKAFAGDVHEGRVAPQQGGRFTDLLVIGIGGSALGPQFVSSALGQPGRDRMRIWFLDNTDPDGMDLTLAHLTHGQPRKPGHPLADTLTVVISKSGGTKETRNGQLEAQAAYERAGLRFERHAVAITREASELSVKAGRDGWLEQFPMWDWVGGRTSELSAVGLLPAALQGLDVDGLLEGARRMDEATRVAETRRNPAALMALMWYYGTNGRGAKDMVVIPYKDRLLLFSRYLQQLVMESLGKECDLQGREVNQGITVYGNKGSTDQHAYIQQLRDGVANFFVTFIEVLQERRAPAFFVEEGVTAGDYLHGFLQGTREALHAKGRESMTLTMPDLSAGSIGALIALYERAVGLYASLININPYHQPGVEAGKKAAGVLLALQQKVMAELARQAGGKLSADQWAQAVGMLDQAEAVYQMLRRLAANPERGIRAEGISPSESVFWLERK